MCPSIPLKQEVKLTEGKGKQEGVQACKGRERERELRDNTKRV